MAHSDSHSKKPKRATGPRTPEGKAISSRNSTTHGCCANKLILPGESQEEYDQLLTGWMDSYEPSTAEAIYLVREACTAQWLLIRNRGRYNEAEQRVCYEQPCAVDWTDEQHKLIERFRRYMTQAERQFNRAFSMLEQLRRNRFRESMTRQRADERAVELERKRAEKAAGVREKAARAAVREQTRLVRTSAAGQNGQTNGGAGGFARQELGIRKQQPAGWLDDRNKGMPGRTVNQLGSASS